MRPGDSYTARQIRLIRDSMAWVLNNLKQMNEDLGTDYMKREVETLRLPTERESAASNYRTREA